jgi:hypothetical protein
MITPDTYDGDGEHLVVFCAPTSVDRVGFTARRSGFEDADTDAEEPEEVGFGDLFG